MFIQLPQSGPDGTNPLAFYYFVIHPNALFTTFYKIT